jgi:hypothetical protein
MKSVGLAAVHQFGLRLAVGRAGLAADAVAGNPALTGEGSSKQDRNVIRADRMIPTCDIVPRIGSPEVELQHDAACLVFTAGARLDR